MDTIAAFVDCCCCCYAIALIAHGEHLIAGDTPRCLLRCLRWCIYVYIVVTLRCDFVALLRLLLHRVGTLVILLLLRCVVDFTFCCCLLR